MVFLVRPCHRNIARAQAKAPKLHFHDWAYVQNTTTPDERPGAQFENLVPTHLLKHAGFLADNAGEAGELNYLRTTSGKEVDFMLTNATGDAMQFVEVKWSDDRPSFSLTQMAQTHPDAQAIQLVRNARHAFDRDGAAVHPAAQWLAAPTAGPLWPDAIARRAMASVETACAAARVVRSRRCSA